MGVELPIIANLTVCVSRCADRRLANQQMICLHNNRTVQYNAVHGCPHPAQNKFHGATLAAPALDPMTIAGPLLWRELHRWSLTAILKVDFDFIDNFSIKIPCGECQDHWRKDVAANPPPWTNRDELFAWTVGRHNAVNGRLEKSIISIEEGYRIWARASQNGGNPLPSDQGPALLPPNAPESILEPIQICRQNDVEGIRRAICQKCPEQQYTRLSVLAPATIIVGCRLTGACCGRAHGEINLRSGLCPAHRWG